MLEGCNGGALLNCNDVIVSAHVTQTGKWYVFLLSLSVTYMHIESSLLSSVPCFYRKWMISTISSLLVAPSNSCSFLTLCLWYSFCHTFIQTHQVGYSVFPSSLATNILCVYTFIPFLYFFNFIILTMFFFFFVCECVSIDVCDSYSQRVN